MQIQFDFNSAKVRAESQQALGNLFDKQRIVFWYDTRREFRADFEALSLPGEANPDLTMDGGVYTFAREVVTRVSNIFGVRMGAVFMISTATIWFRSGSMPRWVVVLTYLVALVQLVTITLSLWLAILFPLWVLIVSLHFLVRSSGHHAEPAAAPL